MIFRLDLAILFILITVTGIVSSSVTIMIVDDEYIIRPFHGVWWLITPLCGLFLITGLSLGVYVLKSKGMAKGE